MSIFDHYTDWNKIGPTQKSINSVWVNEMKAHEYNPVHIHQGKLYTGLSSVMVFKITKGDRHRVFLSRETHEW